MDRLSHGALFYVLALAGCEIKLSEGADMACPDYTIAFIVNGGISDRYLPSFARLSYGCCLLGIRGFAISNNVSLALNSWSI